MSEYTITESEAVTLTTEYQNNHSGQTRAFSIDKAEIDEIFSDNPEAEGIRAYLGQEENAGSLKLVLVATDSNGKDILDNIYDHCGRCPSDCDDQSVLNNGN